MGVERYLVASTVNVVVAQRLVRKLCENCKTPVVFDETMHKKLIGSDPEDSFHKQFLDASKGVLTHGQQIYEAHGCEQCSDLGYSGRLAIAEVLEVTDIVKELIYKDASPMEIEAAAKAEGFKCLLDDGLDKVAKGFVPLSELIRVIKT